MNCRHCNTPLEHPFLDLGFAPPSNAYLNPEDLGKPEKYFPLRVKVCGQCWLVQTEDYAEADQLFSNEYAYFSSTSTGWLEHAATYVAKMIRQLPLGPESMVIEIASNDGYLLKNFLAAEIPCLGIEPTASTAAAAEMIGIPVMREFFGEAIGNRLADAGKRADLVVGNNVYAHVPDINDFTRGLKAVLKPFGTITLEFPHLTRLIEHTQFDTIYHEHFSYLSLYTADRIFCAAGLRIWDVEQLLTHGGSLRIYAGHLVEDHAVSPLVKAVLEEEAQCGLQDADVYLGFQAKADLIKYDLLEFLIEQKRSGRKVAAYGAAAKGNTLLNYAGVRPDLLPFVCDAAPAKQGKLLPGSHIPIFHPHAMEEFCPDYVLVLPWNIVDEVNEQNKRIRTAGAKFVTAVPRLKIV